LFGEPEVPIDTATAQFAKKSVTLNVYAMPDGKIEQLLVEGGI